MYDAKGNGMTSPTNSPENSLGNHGSSRSALPSLFVARLMDLWMVFVLVMFFLLRVYGSNTGQRLLQHLNRGHLL
jgi:hypothetical protein